ncbi:hypothetical protein N7450_000019 [Penicillium hetheringtonii]|uniref:Uncharacterized protein n=1 Tax=Penicillium hetheringtonii TaxID=911720 RepID=A0AAD6GYY8_9EURO|nr:hypothetical protein N7450_000019 [Penicillium hetheringtonii]
MDKKLRVLGSYPWIRFQNAIAPFDEDTFPNEIPREFNKLRIYVIKESLAAILGEWDTGNIKYFNERVIEN